MSCNIKFIEKVNIIDIDEKADFQEKPSSEFDEDEFYQSFSETDEKQEGPANGPTENLQVINPGWCAVDQNNIIEKTNTW